MNTNKIVNLPLLIQFPDIGCCTGAGAGAANISANGFPNCNKSSEAFDEVCALAAVESGGPNKSTIFPELAGGDDKNGFVAALAALFVGDDTFVCLRIERGRLLVYREGNFLYQTFQMLKRNPNFF